MSQLDSTGASTQPRTDRPHFWVPAMIVAWSSGLLFLSVVCLMWVLGDGIDLLNDLLSGPRLRASQTIWPLSVLIFVLIWFPGTMMVYRVHRSRWITLGTAICGVLAFLTVTMVILAFVPGGNPR